MKVTLRKVLLLTLFVLVLTALFVVGANAATLNSTDNADITDDATAVTAGAVARVGDAGGAYYTTLQGAITAANASESGGTITLLADVTISELAETMPISKPITIDGTNATNGKHKISATGAVNLFAVSANFTLQNVHIKYVCTADAGTIISASSFAGVINIKNSELDSDRRGIYLYRASKASQLNISDNSVIVANGSPLAIETGSGSISIKDSYVLCRGTFNYSSSTAVLCYGATSGTPDNSTITVENSTIAAGGGYALHLRRANTVIKLGKDAIVTKNLSDVAGHKLGIGNGCSFYAQQSPSKPKLILDYNAKLEGRNSHDIRFAHSAKSQEIYFGENYTGAIVCRGHEGAVPGTAGKTTDYRFYDTLSDAIKNGYAYILINHNVDLGDQIVSISKNLNFYIANIVDANIQKSNFVPTITSNADVAFSITGTISVSFTGVNITASNVAFAYGDNADANASVVLNNVTLNAATYTTGMNDGDSVTPLLAKIGTLHYATLQDAIDNAVANDTITLVGNVTLEDSIIINKNLTIDGAGYTITSNNDSAFTINDGGKLALNNVNAVGPVLQGNAAGNVTTNSAALATYLAENDNCVMSDSVEGIYTVTGTYVAAFNGTKYASLLEAITAANASENGGTITLLKDIGSSDTPWLVSATLRATKPIVIDGAKPGTEGGKYRITANVADGVTCNLFTATPGISFTLQNIEILYKAPNGNCILFSDTGAHRITIQNAGLASVGTTLYIKYPHAGTRILISNSNVLSNESKPIHLHGGKQNSNSKLDIVDSLLSSAKDVVIHHQNPDVFINLKGNTRLVNDGSAVEEFAHFGFAAPGKGTYTILCVERSPDLIITFYDTATFKSGTPGYLIDYSSNKPRYDVRFHESYKGNFVAAARPNDGGREQIYLHESLQSALNQYKKGIIYLAPNITFAETVSLTWNPTFVSPFKDDANSFPNTPIVTNFTYTGEGAAFNVVGAISPTFSNANIVSNNVAFDFGNNADANASVTLNDVVLTAATVTTGMNDGDTITSLVAKIGNTYYTSLELAIANAVDGDTITLLDNITLTNGAFTLKKPLTIDGQGKYFITNTCNSNQTLFNVKANLTLKDIVKLEQTGSNKHVILVEVVTATVEINNTDITSTNSKAICYYMAYPGSKLIVKDSVIRNTAGEVVISIEQSDLTEFTLDNTAVIGAARHAILVDKVFAGTINIQNNSLVYANGDSDNESAAIRINACAEGATLNVTNSVITSGSSMLRVWQGYLTINLNEGAVVSNDVDNAKVSEMLTKYSLTLNVLDSNEFYGAKVNNSGTHCTIVLDKDAVLEHITKKDVVFAEGSVNNSTVSFAENYAGCIVLLSADNTLYEFYNTLEDAVTGAASGETIVLHKNVELAAPITIDKDLALDLGGKTLNAGLTIGAAVTVKNGAIKADTAFTLNDGAALTINDDVTVEATNVLSNYSTEKSVTVMVESLAKALNDAGFALVNNAGVYTVVTNAPVAAIDGWNYATLEAALADANDKATITLLTDSAEAVTVNKAITLDLGGKTLNAGLTIGAAVTVKNGAIKAATAFTLNNGAALTINNDVTVEATNILGNYGTEKSVTVKAETIANALNNAGFALVNNAGVYTVVTNAPAAAIDGWNYATLEAALTAAKGKTATITLLADVTVGNTIVVDSAITFTGDFTLTSNASVAFEISSALTLNIKKVVVTEAVATFALRATTGSTAFVLTDPTASLTLNNTAVEATNVLNGFVATNSVTTTNADTATAINNDGYAMTSATVGETTTYTVNIAGASVTKDGVETNYVSLADALANVTDGCTITLFANAELTESVAVDKAITINGNGHKVTSTADATFSVADAGKLTVNNTVVENTAENGVAFALNAGAELAMLENTSVTAAKVLAVTAGDEVTVTTTSSDIADKMNAQGLAIGSTANGFEILSTAPEASLNGKYYVTFVEAFEKAVAGETVIVVNDVTLASAITIAKDLTIDLGGKTVTATAGNAFEITAGNVSFTNGTIVAANCAIVVRGGELTIKDGFYTGATAVYVKGGNVTIEGGEFTGNGDANAYVSGSDAVATGDAFVIEVCSDTAPVVNIKDGTFTSINAKTVASYAADTYTAVQEIVSGGRFKGVSNLDDALYKFGYSIGATDSLGY
ncbi:MAG: hypothetical protein IJY43_03770, partial [Clostridia bacterium]|nr:hypothetical protein [Clostridia bacterium]